MPRKPERVRGDAAAGTEALRRRIAAVREESRAAAAELECLKKHIELLETRAGISVFRQKPGGCPTVESSVPEDMERLKTSASKLSESAPTFQADVRLTEAGGAGRTLRIVGGLVCSDDRGTPESIVGIRYEITDKLGKICEIGEHAKQLRELLDNATALVYRFDLKHGVFQYSNRLAQQFPVFRESPGTGSAHEKLVRDVHPEDLGRVSEVIRAAVNTPTETKSSITLEYRRRNDRGEYRWLFEKLTFLPDSTGNISTIISSSVDISPLKDVQEALKASERRYRMMIDLSPDMIWILDTDLKPVFVSHATEKLLGYSPEEFIRITATEYQAPDTLKKIKELLRDHLLRETALLGSISPQRCELKLRHRDGRLILGELVFSAYRDDSGRVLGICGATRDITERKTLEEDMRRTQRELERRIADRSDKLAYVNTKLTSEMERRKQMEYFMLHHPERDRAVIGRELNEGLCRELTGIMSLCEVVRENIEGCDAVATEDVTAIRDLLADAVRQARSMVKGLNPLQEDPRSLDASLRQLAEHTSELFNLRCALTCAGEIEVGNPTLALSLYRIAQEAVHNAIRHGNAHKIDILLRGDAGNIHLSVADDGVGRKGKPENPKGMGLKIMAYRMQAMSGTLRILDGPEGGVRVECSAPKR